jgi:hypothetical protein
MTMDDRIASHYSEDSKLADAIAQKLRSAGKDLNKLTTADLAIVDEFHIRGRKATLELGEKMNLKAVAHNICECEASHCCVHGLVLDP